MATELICKIKIKSNLTMTNYNCIDFARDHHVTKQK